MFKRVKIADDRKSLKTSRNFLGSERGYVAALSAISMPMLLGFALLIIDGGRGNNLHTDLQNAVDAMALTGARELDGRNDAIARSKTAIANILNEVSFSGGGTSSSPSGNPMGASLNLKYTVNDPANSTVWVHFLKSIPNTDNHADWHSPTAMATHFTTDSTEAVYVWVKAKPHAMTSIFPVPVGVYRSTVNVVADAVATYRFAACDITPIFVCNPYEGLSGQLSSINYQFGRGDLYGKQFVLEASNPGTAGPGNFGFLETTGPGASDLKDALATGNPGFCFGKSVDTKTGVNAGPVLQGTNTRVGIYGGSFGSYNGNWRYRPSHNVRKGQKGGECKKYDPEPNVNDAMAFPLGETMNPIGGGGGHVSANAQWNINHYWDVSHGGHASYPPSVGYTPPSYLSNPNTVTTNNANPIPYASWPGTQQDFIDKVANEGVFPPSRYDVYDYEYTHNNGSLIGSSAPNTETGRPGCYSEPGVDLSDITEYSRATHGDRRLLVAAILDCTAAALQGKTTDVAVNAYVSMFLSRPAAHEGSDKSMALEVYDITGENGLGTLAEFLREEAELVR